MPRNLQPTDPDESLLAENQRLAIALGAVERQRDDLAELYQQAPLPYLTLDSIGVIHDINFEGVRLLGNRPGLIGRRLYTFVERQDHRRLRDHLRRCREGTPLGLCELRLRHPRDREPIVVQLRSRPVGEASKLFATALIDLSESGEAAAETQRQLDAGREAQAASAAKDQFIAMLSHELRTPLTPVLAAVSALRSKGQLPPALQPVHEMIHRNLSAEARLIDDLLDATRIARGKMHLEFSPTDLHDAAADVVETLSSEVQAKRHRVVVALDAERHHVMGDPVRLRQVLWNLLRNAVKFTPPGGTIELHSWNNSQGIAVEVSDNGQGFEPEAAPRLFSPFEQAGGAEAGGSGGLGLGLSICRGLVELHGGQLTAASPGPGRGARFVMLIGTVAATQATAAPAPPPAPTPAAPSEVTRPRILLVEDHVDTAELLLELFMAEGFEVQRAGSIGTALALDLDQVDLVVSDIGLPDGSGLDLMRQLSQRPRIKGIALSGYGTEADVRAGREAGFSAHITKPVDWPRLLTTVQQLWEQRSK
jgi:signal transduction histidine kinase